MKIDWNHVRVNGKGHAGIEIDHIEDFWTLASVIRPGDRVRAQIRRKIKTERSGTGKTETTATLMVAKIEIQEIDFQPGVEEMGLRGTLVHNIEGGKAGTFQRVMLAAGRPFVLSKSLWDPFTIELLREASDPVSNATVAAVLMVNGVANVCLIGRNATRIVDHIEKSMPKIRKMGDSGKNQVARGKFFNIVANSLVSKIPIADMKCIIVASPGFTAREFMAYLDENKNTLQITAAFQGNKFIVATSTGAHLDALDHLLLTPEIAEHIQELKAVKQARAWADFQKEINRDVNSVSLGPVSVMDDLKIKAVKVLMATDSYIMSLEFEPRMEYLRYRDELTEEGLDAVQFAASHPTGKQLNDMAGGIAAILKYPIVRQADGGFDAPFDGTS